MKDSFVKPTMSRTRKVLLFIFGSLTFVIVGLPYVLPLTGSAPVDPVTLAEVKECAPGAFCAVLLR